MKVRQALKKDIDRITELLNQVLSVHHQGRADLFKPNCRKYTDEELLEIIEDSNRPILVAVDDNDEVMGYAFLIIKQYINDNILTDIKTLYIDDLCVDENVRGKHIGRLLYNSVIELAKKMDCYNVTLNVWGCNKSALKFYEKCGLEVQKIGMEKILK